MDPKFIPARVELLVVLANLGRFDQAEAISRAMLGDILANTASQANRANLLFAYAEMLRKNADYEVSFAALKEANDLTLMELSAKRPPSAAIALASEHARHRTPDAAEAMHEAVCDFVMRIFDAEFFANFVEPDLPRRGRVFITGMPRSGSTLIEQILSSHPDVFGAGEVDDLNRTYIHTWPFTGPKIDGGAPQTSADLPPKRPGHFRQLGQTYHDLMQARSAEAKVFVNKMLGNYLHIGMIHMTLPGATIIDARREPMDNCFACY